MQDRNKFAWDIFGDGTNSVHGCYGLFSNKVGDLAYVNGIPTNSRRNDSSELLLWDKQQRPHWIRATSRYPVQVDSRGGPEATFTPPMMQDWALGVQHSLGRSMVIEADSFGTARRYLYFLTDSNPLRAT